jgi:hypothetical protein
MKKKYIFLLLLALGISFTSCTKDFENGLDYNDGNAGTGNNNGNGTGNGNGNGNTTADIGAFKATVSGNAFAANEVQAIVNEDYIAVSGLKTTGELIQITLADGKVGTYTFIDTPDLVIAYAKGNEWVYLGVPKENAEGYTDYTDNAIVKITEIDKEKKTISGTFQFTGLRFDGVKDKKEITNGSFTKIPYKSDAPVLQPDNKFSAKLDGADFASTNVSVATVMGKIAITAKRGNVENIALLVPGDVKVGTYNVDDNYVIRYSKSMNAEGLFDGKSGSTITILKHDQTKKTISGTFSSTTVSYTTTEKHEITDGSFDVSY